MYWCSLLIFCCVYEVFTYNFNLKNVKRIKLNENNDTYFGYSVLLQTGSKPMVIVGVPKANPVSGGAVYACNLSGDCTVYSSLVVSNENTFSGNFLGSVLDGGENIGGEFIACAPKKVTVEKTNNFIRGICFYKRNSTRYDNHDLILSPIQSEDAISVDGGVSYYNFGFGEAGFDVHLIKESNQVLFGAPGVSSWSGSLVTQSLINLYDHSIIPLRNRIQYEDVYQYLGYSVTTGKTSTKSILYVAGAPRGNFMTGMVRVYDGSKLISTLRGQELGSYFGSSLLASDVTGDGIDELFVGAPMGAGNTYDEGYVYVYSNNRNSQLKLAGSKKVGARFGTSIADLGDIDLDGYNDVAISASYEDGGVGAVYIYRGSKNGMHPDYAQRLSPLVFGADFARTRGFGLGISRGNDIDGNGHNDLAVGAYKSGEVFIVKGSTIIDFQLYLDSNVTSITGDAMNATYCVHYTKRSPARDVRNVVFEMNLQLDYRTVGGRSLNATWTVPLDRKYCKGISVSISQSVVDLEPFKMHLGTRVDGDIVAKGQAKLEKFIPYVHGCGEDNVCQTKISLIATTDTPSIVLGADKEFWINILADNQGETGYQCSLYLDLPPAVYLADKSLCRAENETYVCSFASRLVRTKEVKFKLEIDSSTAPVSETELANFWIECLGENLAPGKANVSFDIVVVNSPYVEGKSDPENVFLDDSNLDVAIVTYKFTVGNFGPSPVKLDVYMLMPIVQIDGSDIFELEKAQGSLRGEKLRCSPSKKTGAYEKNYDVQTVITEPLNETAVIDCFEEGAACLEVSCAGDHLLAKSSEVAEYTMTVKIETSLLSTYYRKQLKKSLAAYVVSAFLFNTTARIEGHTSTLLVYSEPKGVSSWIYVVAAVLGIILLSVLVLLLYKCHFFDRAYRDKLNDEKLLDQPLQLSPDDKNDFENVCMSETDNH